MSSIVIDFEAMCAKLPVYIYILTIRFWKVLPEEGPSDPTAAQAWNV